jgi:hypothetical protein
MYDAIVNLLQRVDPTIFIVLALAFGMAIVSSIICQIGKFRRREQELAFKREMLLHGVPAEEIERTLAAPFKDSNESTPIYNGNVVIHQTEPYKPATQQAAR